MANPPTPSEILFDAYLHAHGYIVELRVNWRSRFAVDSDKDPDRLVSRALEELAICEVKERTSTSVDRRLAEHGSGSFSSERVLAPASRKVEDAAEQLAPFSSTGLPLVAVLANPRHLFVPLGADDMTRTLFGTSDTIQIAARGPAIPRRVSSGTGALARRDPGGELYNPYPHLSAVVVVHARTNEQDFVEQELAAARSPEEALTEAARRAKATSMLQALNAANRDGRVPAGGYEWVEVFDLSGLGDAFSGVALPDNIFDGARDRRYVIDQQRGFVERS
jgi:hypothetical protein